jgi:hypothetical protein
VTPIHIHNLAAPTEGSRPFDKSPITFGRDNACDILLPVKHASRQHGELRFESDQWWLVNRSANGTTVSGRTVTSKPRALRDRDVVSIGDQPAFEVRLATAVPAAAPVVAAAPQARKRTGLFIAIGVYLLAMLVLVVFLATLKPGGDKTITAPELTNEQIAAAIRAPLPGVTANERDMRQNLQEARELYIRPTTGSDTLFRTYLAYRRALAFSGKPQFEDGLDQRQFYDVEDRFIEEVTQRYRMGYQKVMSGQYTQAEQTLRELQQFYNDPTSEVFQNVQKQREIAAQHAKRKRR